MRPGHEMRGGPVKTHQAKHGPRRGSDRTQLGPDVDPPLTPGAGGCTQHRSGVCVPDTGTASPSVSACGHVSAHPPRPAGCWKRVPSSTQPRLSTSICLSANHVSVHPSIHPSSVYLPSTEGVVCAVLGKTALGGQGTGLNASLGAHKKGCHWMQRLSAANDPHYLLQTREERPL